MSHILRSAEHLNEHNETAAVCDYLHYKYPKVLFFSVPNGAHLAGGAKQRAASMNILKREGFLPGVADLVIFEPRGPYSCFFLEMKRAVGGVLSDNQRDFLIEVEKRGAFAAVAHGADEAIEFIDTYLALEI